jgi:hypothetical protein
MPTKPYALGDAISKEDCDAVFVRMVPDAKKRRKVARDSTRFIAMMMAHVPARLEHEVNRLRGLAFDGGEEGFEYSRGESS